MRYIVFTCILVPTFHAILGIGTNSSQRGIQFLYLTNVKFELFKFDHKPEFCFCIHEMIFGNPYLHL